MRLPLALALTLIATTALTAPSVQASPRATCATDSKPLVRPKQQFKKPTAVLKKGKRYILAMNTSCGTIRIVLDTKLGGPVPNSVAFLSLKHFYDGLRFHRVVKDFVLQGGDPQNNGRGGPGYTVVGPLPRSYRYKVGDVAMAKKSSDKPGTAGSQLFVISGSGGKTLPPDYALLGHATDPDSLATIRSISALSTLICGNPQGCPPKTPVWIISMRLLQIP